jgi:hypothetical protein
MLTAAAWKRSVTVLVAIMALAASGRAEFPNFQEVVIDAQACERAVYAVTLADVDGDGRDDIVAVTENAVVWYQNPDWKKRLIIENQTELDNVCIAAHDIDGDGKVDFALGAGWTKVGTIQWLQRGESLEEKWKVHAIGVEPWTHRMSWADVLGEGKPQLVVSPLNATEGDGVKLLAFSIPDNPTSDRWRQTVLDDTLNRLHNHWHLDFDGNGISETLTASQEGVHAIYKEEGEIRRLKIANGIEGDNAQSSGSGEIKSGRLGNGLPFAVTIEPMHGTTVAVYTAEGGELKEGELARRQVLEETLQQGHAIWTANLDDDPADEIVIGFREEGTGEVKGPGIFIFDADDPQGSSWTRHVIDDGGMACEDAVCGDLNGDGRIDIVAGGRKTRNVKLYLNVGP